jgi:hypothetical protein
MEQLRLKIYHILKEENGEKQLLLRENLGRKASSDDLSAAGRCAFVLFPASDIHPHPLFFSD